MVSSRLRPLLSAVKTSNYDKFLDPPPRARPSLGTYLSSLAVLEMQDEVHMYSYMQVVVVVQSWMTADPCLA